MKKLTFLLILFALFLSNAFSQTNTLPDTGKVGIGTTDPNYLLDVKGPVMLGRDINGGIGSENSGILFSRFTSSLADVPGSTGGTQITGPIHAHVVMDIQGNDPGDGFYVRVPSNLQVNPTVNKTAFVVKATGFVGIGTSSPGHTLHIAKASSNSISLGNGPNFLLSRNNVNGTNEIRSYGLDLEIETRNSTEDIFFNTNNGANKLLTIKGTGNVGIGTTTPKTKLHVASGGGGVIGLQVDGRIKSNSSDGGIFLDNNNHGFVGNNNSNVGFWTIGVGWEAFQINKATGNVGIGTTDPQNKLDINGTARAKEILVEEGWGDYVFCEDYALPSLEEEEKHIEEKGRLSGFQSAEEMNGEIQLGDVTKRQQVKIEEIMLHLIEMNETFLNKIEILEAEIKALKEQ